MRTFTVDRMNNVATEAMGKIRQQLGLVTIGGITPFEAIRVINSSWATTRHSVRPPSCAPRSAGHLRWLQTSAWCRPLA